MIHRVQLHQAHNIGRHHVDRVEDRGCIHPRQSSNTPEMGDITEIDRQRRQHHSHAATEQKQEDDGHRGQQDCPVKMCPRHKHDNQDRRQAETHCHKTGRYTRYRENKLGNIDFFDQSGVYQHGMHRHTGALSKKTEQRLPADQIQRVILYIRPENMTEYNRHNCHHQQGIQETPKIPQYAAAILNLDIPNDQLMNQRLIFYEMLKSTFYSLVHDILFS